MLLEMKPMEDVSLFIKQNKTFKMRFKENISRYKQNLTNYTDIQTTHLNLLKRAKKKLHEYKQNYSDGSRFLRAEVENFSEVRKSRCFIRTLYLNFFSIFYVLNCLDFN